LCLAPVGKAWSLDRVRAVRAAKRKNLQAVLPRFTSPWACACTRLIQLQMAVLYFSSGFEKIRADDWYEGNAVWFLFASSEQYSQRLLDLFASQYWIVNLGTYATILIELSYPFLIWRRRERPYMLSAALFLHFMIAAFLRMYYFAFVMSMGNMSFLRPEWLKNLGEWWKRRAGDMEMVYDGRCGFCVRSMAWFLAFDGLGQVKVRDFRTQPSPVVPDEKVEKALYTVLPDGRAFPGFDAYRYIVLRVPGLWWMVPLFYIPVLSRLIGRPIYHWVATHRTWLSTATGGTAPAPG
jgi:predicted DCC family thiol-disulfide oxidoreductase YuxK